MPLNKTTSDDIIDEISELDPDLVLVKPDVVKPVRKKKRDVEWGGALIGLIVGVAGILAGRLGQIWFGFDVFSQFTVQFICVAAAFSIAAFLPRRKAFTGLVLSVLAIVVYGLWAQSSVGPVTAGPWQLNPGERAVRVAHFNSYFKNNDLDAIKQEVLRLDADIITMVEFTDEKMPLLDRLKARYPYHVECSNMWGCQLAIFSKFPLTGLKANAQWDGPPFISAAVGGPLQGLTVYGVHTTRFPHSRAQLKQVTALVQSMESISGKLLVMGDFNATPFSRVTAIVAEGLGLDRLTSLPTWPSTVELPQLAIDHIFASKGTRVLAAQQIGHAAGSDHYPIVMTLGIDVQ